MPNAKAAESHKKAGEAAKKQSDKHLEAHQHYSSGNHEKGAHAATSARGSASEAKKHADEADETHSKAHGDKK